MEGVSLLAAFSVVALSGWSRDAILTVGLRLLFKNEAKVLETVSSTHNLHLHIPLTIPIQDRLDEMRLSVCNV